MKRVMRIEKNIKCVFIDAHISCVWFLFGGCVGSAYGAAADPACSSTISCACERKVWEQHGGILVGHCLSLHCVYVYVNTCAATFGMPLIPWSLISYGLA